MAGDAKVIIFMARDFNFVQNSKLDEFLADSGPIFEKKRKTLLLGQGPMVVILGYIYLYLQAKY